MIVKTSLGFAFSLFAACCAAGIQAEPQSGPPTSKTAPNLEMLVREMVRNEERAWKNPPAYFEYQEVDASPQESSVSREIETPEGVFGRLISVNGHPPSAKRSQKNLRQLQKFVKDPAARISMVHGEEEDVRMRMEMLKEFPDAFYLESDGPEVNGVIRIKFEPNPAYRPQSRNALALRGAEGIIWINLSSERLVKVEGTLIHDVSLGWGVLVRLNRGGRFGWEQAEVSPGIWELTKLSVNVKGKIFLVKSLDLQITEAHKAFKRVSDHLDAAQAVAMLLGRDGEATASNQ